MKHIIMSLALITSFGAQAQFVNGNKLLNDMDSSAQAQRSFSLGYITGVVDALDGDWFCIPSTVTVGQMNDIVRRYLVINANIRHLHGGALAGLALQEAFPCKKGKSS